MKKQTLLNEVFWSPKRGLHFGRNYYVVSPKFGTIVKCNLAYRNNMSKIQNYKELNNVLKGDTRYITNKSFQLEPVPYCKTLIGYYHEYGDIRSTVSHNFFYSFANDLTEMPDKINAYKVPFIPYKVSMHNIYNKSVCKQLVSYSAFNPFAKYNAFQSEEVNNAWHLAINEINLINELPTKIKVVDDDKNVLPYAGAIEIIAGATDSIVFDNALYICANRKDAFKLLYDKEWSKANQINRRLEAIIKHLEMVMYHDSDCVSLDRGPSWKGHYIIRAIGTISILMEQFYPAYLNFYVDNLIKWMCGFCGFDDSMYEYLGDSSVEEIEADYTFNFIENLTRLNSLMNDLRNKKHKFFFLEQLHEFVYNRERYLRYL